MIDLECPSCGRGGSAPNDKVNTRLVCKKCHTVFHVTDTGRTVLGEPGRDREAVLASAQAYANSGGVASLSEVDWVETLFHPSTRRMKGVIAALVIGVLGTGYVILAGRNPDLLSVRAQEAANALAAEDISTVKRFAWSRTSDEVSRWCESLHPHVDELKKLSLGHDVLASIFVIEENHSGQKGQVLLSFTPSTGPSHTQAIASAAGLPPADQSVKQVMTYWVLDRGYWRIDGKQTVAVPPVSVAPTPEVGLPAAATARR